MKKLPVLFLFNACIAVAMLMCTHPGANSEVKSTTTQDTSTTIFWESLLTCLPDVTLTQVSDINSFTLNPGSTNHTFIEEDSIQLSIAISRLYTENIPTQMLYDSAQQKLRFIDKPLDSISNKLLHCLIKESGYHQNDTLPFIPSNTIPHAYFIPKQDLMKALGDTSSSIIGIRVYYANYHLNYGKLEDNGTHLYVVPVDRDTNDYFPKDPNTNPQKPYAFDLTHPCPKVCDKHIHNNPLNNPLGWFE